MSDSQSINTSLSEGIIASKSEQVVIRDLSDLTLRIILDAWWASMNVSSKCLIGWSCSRHAPLWQFYFHCGIEETGNPGVICIVCHQVLRHPSEHGTSPIEKHLLAKVHIAKWNKLTEWEVLKSTNTTVDKTAFAIFLRQGTRGITIVSSQEKLIFDS